MFHAGLGQNWLQRAQATIVAIHQEEDTTSGSSSKQRVPSPPSRKLREIDNFAASPPRDPRRQGPLYVEARGLLQPAVDFYSRAVSSADSAGTTSGDLLCSVSLQIILKEQTDTLQAAEAHMSLGNVTASPNDEHHFAHAIRYLRRAEALPDYQLSEDNLQYLEDYGRYVN